MRQIVMPGIGEEGQEILKNAKVLVVRVRRLGLSCPLLPDGGRRG